MKIELDKKQIDEVTRQTIEALEKEVRSLSSKLKNRDAKIARLESVMDVSADRRNRIRELANELVSALEDAGWKEYDEFM